MTRRKTGALTANEQFTLYRLENFAKRNNLKLFNVKGSLYDRVRTIADNSGRCPCNSDRKWCPCQQAIQECKEKGECSCRIFVAPKCK